jgi:hypothetical protein
VRQLRFRRTRDPEGLPRWYAEGLSFAHQQGVTQFADTIATFALRKQAAGQLANEHQALPGDVREGLVGSGV